MGYAVIMFGILLIVSVVVVTAYNYGVAKDSQIVPLKAENTYAERETGKAQTALTIVYTCLSDTSDGTNDGYIKPQGNNDPNSGPHKLNLVVKNNGSTVLNPNSATVLYNASHINFTVTDWQDHWKPHWDGDNYELDEDCEHDTGMVKVWTPLSYVCKKTAQNIFIPTPNNSSDSPAIRLLVTAENGISTIAPTSPINFTGIYGSSAYIFSWNASYDEDGIAYYRIYGLSGTIVNCKEPKYKFFQEVPGNQTTASVPCSTCTNLWFYITAVDKLQNEGVQSRTLKCNPGSNPCQY